MLNRAEGNETERNRTERDVVVVKAASLADLLQLFVTYSEGRKEGRKREQCDKFKASLG